MTTSHASIGQRLVGIALVAMLAAAVLLAVPQQASAQSSYLNVDQRLVDSFAEAGVSISQSDYDPAEVDAVVLATDANFPDGLTASAVAAEVGGPVLFTSRVVLPEITAAEIDRLLDPGDTVYVMGGSAAVSDSVVDELSDYTVERVEGATRLETAVAAADLVGVPEDGEVLLARAFGPDGANTPSDRSTGWVDAISCGAYAAANGIPIYLSETNVLSTSTSQALAGSEAESVTVCGGTAAISDDVLDSLRSLGLTVRRVQGPTRVETAVAAAQELFGHVIAGLRDFTVINGYGENYGYGLAAAPLGDPILLVGRDEPTSCTNTAQPSRQTLCYLQTGTETNPANILLMGDDSIISDAVADAVGDAAGGTDVNDLARLATPGGVTATDDLNDDGTRATVSWSAVADPDDIMDGYNVYVDDVRVGPVPTVPEGTLTYELTGLTPDEEVEVVVTAVDIADRESDRSAPTTVTPEDEEPADATNFTANPGNGAVLLSWAASPSRDLVDYTLQRAEATSCNGATFADLEESVDDDATTYTDDTAVNGTSYCYRLIANDASSSTDGVVAGPAVPSAIVPGLTYTAPEGTVHYPGPIEVAWTLNPAVGDPEDYLITLAYSVNGGGSYFPIAAPFRHGDEPADTYTWNMPRSPAEDITDGDHERLDQSITNGDLRIRVFAEPPSGSGAGDSQVVSPGLNLSRAPRQVADFVGTAGSESARLTWQQNPEVARLDGQAGEREVLYEVFVDTASSLTDECLPISAGTYEQVESGEVSSDNTLPDDDDTVFTDITGLSNGNAQSNPIYCFYVRPVRVLTDNTRINGPNSSVVAVDPEAQPGAAITILSPSDGSTVRQSPRTYTFRFDLANPQDVDLVDIVAYYCADADPNSFTGDLECQSGEEEFGIRTLSATAEQEGTITWTTTVPVTGQGTETGLLNPDAGEDQLGWIRVQLRGTAGAGLATDVATGLRFR